MAKFQPKTKDELKELLNNLEINLADIDTSLITDMSELFVDVGRSDFSGLETWDVSNVEDMSGMFKGDRTF
ncbi:BspA family leucine-rich repeat surface protein [uncultured Campylobacter sp.]|uniref:BspA family leucine-rich repeat surface protein n=1 Tax=uncultured Campylobacter sp. TaxID=218934 RepID=UPI0026042573|nr:BspA family leucine-rich repeat surface protein [uncultured Campylobacter sp.]